ncbi:family 10 glycosylhydrolase [Fuerstiella marisgermanici]|nr:family 10 glycosylhydrolase [Fuerstiella marisgermanici]
MRTTRPQARRATPWLLATLCLSAVSAKTAQCEDQPFMGAYLNIPRMFDSSSDIPTRERSIEEQLDRFKASGLRVVMPYATTTAGASLYPTDIIPTNLYPNWDPLRVVVRAARARGLQVYPVICVLACGKNEPKGILRQHPDWALRDDTGSPIGHISPCHPQARAWVVSVLQEIAGKYKPDGLLLDYLRFNNRPMQLDPQGAIEFDKLMSDKSATDRTQALQRFKEDCLTELMRNISVELRRQQPEIKLAIYSWGPHVTQNHRVAQDWGTWAKNKYIDMVNVSGYCFPKNYGDRYLQVFEDRIQGALDINKKLGQPIDVTVCLGIRTSHGQIDKASDVDDYLSIASRLGVDGTAVFMWSYVQPYLDDIKQHGYFEKFENGVKGHP